jgi:SAM-dependent methyltransferase
MQINTSATMRNTAKAIARQIPSINALIAQRDSLLEENAALKQQMRPAPVSPSSATAYQPGRRKHFVHDYQTFVRHLIATHPIDDAMSMAVGGAYDTIGGIEVAILRACGLRETHALIDLGCGSGRLAKHIGKTFPRLNYVGIDVVPELLAYAARQSPQHFRFIEHHDVGFPAPDESADFIAAFSVFTHLFHEESYIYLQDAKRVLRPGGAVVFSFLETGSNWQIFEGMINTAKASGTPDMLVMYIERPQIKVWATHLGLEIAGFNIGPPVGQSVVMLRKPARAA